MKTLIIAILIVFSFSVIFSANAESADELRDKAYQFMKSGNFSDAIDTSEVWLPWFDQTETPSGWSASQGQAATLFVCPAKLLRVYFRVFISDAQFR